MSWELPEGTFTYWHAAIAGLVTVKTAPDIRALASAGPGISVSGTYSVTDFGATTCVPVDSSSFMFRCDTTGLVSQYSGVHPVQPGHQLGGREGLRRLRGPAGHAHVYGHKLQRHSALVVRMLLARGRRYGRPKSERALAFLQAPALVS